MKDETIKIRVSPEEKMIISDMARCKGVSNSRFLIESALKSQKSFGKLSFDVIAEQNGKELSRHHLSEELADENGTIPKKEWERLQNEASDFILSKVNCKELPEGIIFSILVNGKKKPALQKGSDRIGF